MNNDKNSTEAFRVPNSIIQGLTTRANDPVGDGVSTLHRLSAFEMVTLLGLMTLVNPKHPQREVRSTPTQLLDIIEVGRNVSHAVDRKWSGSDGRQRHKEYSEHRHSPRHVEMIHESLLKLFQQSVRILGVEKDRERTDKFVHILDSFGYVYECNGKPVDPDNLPAGVEKTNQGTDDRPVWRFRRRDSDRSWPAKGIVFRLNRELIRELNNQRGTISFTYIARRIFSLLQRHMRTPAMIRLVLLILRQTSPIFVRHLDRLVEDLGFDTTHPERAISDLEKSLAMLQQEGILHSVEVRRCLSWPF